MAERDAAALIAAAGGPEAPAVRLARWVCLASRIEPALLREARLRFLPLVGASAEADLWFGPLVDVRGPREVLLHAGVAEHLRAELVARGEAARARELVVKAHGHLPPLPRLEEELIWLARNGGDAEAQARALRSVLKAVLPGDRPGLTRWALAFLGRVTPEHRTDEMELLERVAGVQLFGGAALAAPGDGGVPLSPEARALLAATLPRTAVGVRVVDGVLELSDPPRPWSILCGVPATEPLVLDVEWDGAAESRPPQRLTLPRGIVHTFRGPGAPAVLSTFTGERYAVASRAEAWARLSDAMGPHLINIWLAVEHAMVVAVAVTPDAVLLALPAETAQSEEPTLPDGRPLEFSLLTVTDQQVQIGLWRSNEALHASRIQLNVPLPPSGTRCGAWIARELNDAGGASGNSLAYMIVPCVLDGGVLRPEMKLPPDRRLRPGSPVSDAEGRFLGLIGDSAAPQGGTVHLITAQEIAALLGEGGSTEVSHAPAAPDDPKAARVYMSYADQNERWAKRISKALSSRFAIEKRWWSERSMPRDWRDKIHETLASSQVVVVLITPEYLASQYLRNEELPLLLGLREQGVPFIPIMLHPSRLRSELWGADVQLLPRGGRALSELSTRELKAELAGLSSEIEHGLSEAASTTPAAVPVQVHGFLDRPAFLVGREEDLAALDWAWASKRCRVFTIVGLAGVGKTALVTEWLRRLAADGYRGASRIFAWSFRDSWNSPRAFLSAFGKFLGIEPAPRIIGTEELARAFALHPSVLVLDGMESLYKPYIDGLRPVGDPAVDELVAVLAGKGRGLCITTSRVSHIDIHGVETRILAPLARDAGIALASRLGLVGARAELERWVDATGGHPLALRRVAALLSSRATSAGFDPMILQQALIEAARTIGWYERWLAEQSAAQWLLVLSVFDAPVTRNVVQVLLDLPEMRQFDWSLGTVEPVALLRHAGLLASHSPDRLELHPVVRAYFRAVARRHFPEMWGAARQYLDAAVADSTIARRTAIGSPDLMTLIARIPAWPTAAELVAGFVPPPRLAETRFGDYRSDPRHPSQAAAVRRLRELTAELRAEAGGGLRQRFFGGRRGGSGVYLDGGFGVGKTHLLAALWHEAPSPSAYLSFDELVHTIGLLGVVGAREAFRGRRLVAVDEWELDDPGNLKMALAFLRGALADGVCVATTSNTIPDELWRGRFAQKSFRAEIEELSSAFEVLEIAGDDYRHRRFEADPDRTYFLDDARMERVASSVSDHALIENFPALLAALGGVHPLRYGELVASIDELLVRGLAPITSVHDGLRWAYFVAKLYDRAVLLAMTSTIALGELFPRHLLIGAYGKKFARCLTHLEEMLGEGGKTAQSR